ncbi:MAG: type II toxin-antitoxin system PemK/MazF family toxin [Chitinivibrionia bacterium]|nr:type II toxin-antitoxin system PemK/MazF family toxin [Chitinivibrionia bacterium]
MMRGEIWWVDFGDPIGSEPGFRRPAVIVQNDKLNINRLATTVVLPITSNLAHKDIQGNVFLNKSVSKLSKDSVILAHQIACVDRAALIEKVSELTNKDLLKRIGNEMMFVLGI